MANTLENAFRAELARINPKISEAFKARPNKKDSFERWFQKYGAM